MEFDFVVSGINRGDNAGLHLIYSGTVGGAREGAVKGAVGIAASLNSHSRSADYSETGRFVAELVTAVASAPKLLVRPEVHHPPHYTAICLCMIHVIHHVTTTTHIIHHACQLVLSTTMFITFTTYDGHSQPK